MKHLTPPDESRSKACIDTLVEHAQSAGFNRVEFAAAVYALGEAIRGGALGADAWEAWIQLTRAGEMARLERKI